MTEKNSNEHNEISEIEKIHVNNQEQCVEQEELITQRFVILQENESMLEPEITHENEVMLEPETTHENEVMLQPEITHENETMLESEIAQENEVTLETEITHGNEPTQAVHERTTYHDFSDEKENFELQEILQSNENIKPENENIKPENERTQKHSSEDTVITAEEPIKQTKVGYRDIFKQRQYMKIIMASLINRFGDSIDSIAFTWLVYEVTKSASWSAIIFGINRIPTIFLQPFAGAMVEGMNKKHIMIVTDLIRGICVGFIATAMILGIVNQWMLLLTTVVISCAEAFRGPASTSLIPKILDKKYYEFGMSLNTSAATIMELIGLGVAGVIIAGLGISAAIYIDMATFFVSAVIILTLQVREEHRDKGKIEIKTYFKDLVGGFHYIKERKILMYFIVIAIFLNAILVPFNSLQAPMVSEVLHSNEIMLSVLNMSFTVGILLGSVVFPYLVSKIKKSTMLSIGSYMIGVYYFTILLAGKMELKVLLYAIVMVSSFLTGIAIALLNSLAGVEFMKCCEEAYLARAASILNAGSIAAMPVSALIIGLGANFINGYDTLYS